MGCVEKQVGCYTLLGFDHHQILTSVCVADPEGWVQLASKVMVEGKAVKPERKGLELASFTSSGLDACLTPGATSSSDGGAAIIVLTILST